MKTTLSYIDKKLALKIAALILIQQFITAVGTFALAKAGFNIENIVQFAFWAVLAMLTHLIAPAMGYFVRPLDTTLTVAAYRQYLNEHLLSKAGSPSFWQQKDKKESFLISIGAEVEMYLAAILLVYIDVFSYALSIILSALVIGYVLDPQFIPAFIVSGAISFFAFRALQKRATTAFEEEQNAKLSLNSYLLTSWENIFFKNSPQINTYKSRLHTLLKNSLEKSKTSVRWYEGLVVILTLVSCLPVMSLIVFTLFKNQGNAPVLIALLATIPRQLTMLGTFRSIFTAVASLISFESKFKILAEGTKLSELGYCNRIKANQIQVENKNYQTTNEIKEQIENATPRRLEVRGNNGSGKSTLLLMLNEQVEESIYLPANPQFDIPNLKVGSTGQNILQHLKHIAQMNEKIILLDEWDANLDEENIEKINTLINEIAKEKVVVEVRHR
ncbi:ATP-binding cassette domain-containing protein [Bdellovibrio sp. GT3]|uniref:ATP-binding cassette domain-containing protein n=1 Tax=Bdellovibrio sp. GT3 TaxID=3136282 RepID=UPI0030F04C3F